MQNTLFTNDNLFVLYGMNSEIVDLIYLDPPFNSKRMYSAPIGTKAAGASFKDMWTWEDVNDAYLDKLIEKYPDLVSFIRSIGAIHSKGMMSYITYMTQRVIQMHRVLKPSGSIYLHCDPTASHYLKILMDEIFGRDNFRNEIIWSYESGGRPKKDFGRKHDIILRYTKSAKWLFNAKDVLLSRENTRHNHMKKSMDEDGRTYYSIKSAGKIYKYYSDEGVIPSDVWQIPYLNNKDPERTGYPTQKPLALMHRIIKASSNQGDIVLDPFCGCATTCVAAQQLGRNWIGIDIEKQAAGVLVERLGDDAGLFKDFIHRTDIPKRTDIAIEPPSPSVKQRLFTQQEGHCNACSIELPIHQFEIDHVIPKSKGGGDYYENYQLLCGSCNRIKGDRPMEYLRIKIRTREELLLKTISFGE
jgi:DNA modification methylase